MVNVYLYTSDRVLSFGLELMGINLVRQQRVKRETNLEDFKAFYGVHPLVVARIWEDLQVTPVQEARIYPTPPWVTNGMVTLANFLHAFHFLKRYQTESERKGTTGYCKTTLRNWCWYFIERIRAQKVVKIVWPQDHEWGATYFIISVDGVHCLFHEEKHATLSKNPDVYSHKSHGPGLSYELALDVWRSRLVWMRHNPLTKHNDRRNFVRAGGLRSKIPAGKKAIADNGYRGKGGDPKVAHPNSHDEPILREFKARARMRQESFNQQVKRFACTNTARFNHKRERHILCFEAVCVICQYKMELVSPLFDV